MTFANAGHAGIVTPPWGTNAVDPRNDPHDALLGV
jgi:hypothetical protein